MKNRLREIRTTYNESSAKYDEVEQFNEKKRIYEKEIDFITRNSQTTQKQFGLKHLDIAFLNSQALKDEPKFKQVKKTMSEYNRKVIENGDSAVNGLHLQTVVMNSMLKFMRLVMLAPDTKTKKTILDIAHHWFNFHLDPKSAKKTSADLEGQIRKILVKKDLLPIDIINKELIITSVQQTLKPYRLKARTMYKQLDAPNIQLKNYHTHKLEFLSGNHNEEVEQKESKWIDKVKFPKIQPPAFYYEVEEPQKIEEQVLPKEEQKKPIITEQTAVQQGQQNQLIEGAPPQQIQQENHPVDLDFGGQPEGEQPQEQEVEVQEKEKEKEKGKLDPLLKIFLLQRMQQKQKQEFSCEKKHQLRNNKVNKTQIQDFSQINVMKQWASQKSRLKTEISKKHQSMKGGYLIPRGRGDTKKYIENQIDKLKVMRVMKDNEKSISKIDHTGQINTQPGLSMFDRRRVKTQASQKPFSTILEDNDRTIQRQKALEEITMLKERLAKNRLYTPLDTISKGLNNPLEKDEDITELKQALIWPNTQMLSNPFFKVAKKKKKKKKK